MYVERLQQKSRNKIVGLYPTVKVTIFLIYAGKYFCSGEGADPVAGSAGGQCVHELRGTGIGIGVQGF